MPFRGLLVQRRDGKATRAFLGGTEISIGLFIGVLKGPLEIHFVR
jgi:hypothetical protein